MMLKIYPFETDILIEGDKVNVVEVVGKKLFVNLAKSFYLLANEDAAANQADLEDIILLEDDKILSLAKNAMVVFDLFNFDFNNKKILNKLYQKLDFIYQNDWDLKMELEQIGSKLMQNFLKASLELDFDLSFRTQLQPQDYFKLLSVKVEASLSSPLAKLLLLIDLLGEFALGKLLILVNVKSYFLEAELQEIYKHAVNKRVNLLILEHLPDDNIYEWEKKLIIDADYDEILV